MKKLATILIVVALATTGLVVAVAPAAADSLLDSVEVGTPSSESAHSIVEQPTGDWGPIEPTTHGGSYGQIASGGSPDWTSGDNLCRTIWGFAEGTTTGQDATFTMNTGSGMTATRLVIRVLDGGSDDSFDLDVNGSTVLSYTDQYTTETWVTHDIDISSGAYTGTLSIRLTATAAAGPYFNPYGQVAVDWAMLYGEESPPEPTPDGNETGKCFIATAAYGSYFEPEVDSLRSFRDDFLQKDATGAGFVSAYYALSPPIADLIDENPALKVPVRAALTPAVALSESAVTIATPAKAAIAVAATLCVMAGALWLLRRTALRQ